MSSGWFGRLVAGLLAATVLVAGVFFSILLVLVAAGLGTVALAYFWWKTRALRRALRDSAAARGPGRAANDARVIDGEARVVDERSDAGPGRQAGRPDRLPH